MGKLDNLTQTERDIMELLWELDRPLSFKETLDYLNERLNKNWKKQTVGTYLTSLQKAGLVHADKRGVRFYIYSPACSREEYMHRCVQQVVTDFFDGSIGKFVASFTGGKKLTIEEADELKKLL